jgi:hypothetical protein
MYAVIKEKNYLLATLPDGTDVGIRNPKELIITDGAIVKGEVKTETKQIQYESGEWSRSMRTDTWFEIDSVNPTNGSFRKIKNMVAKMTPDERISFFDEITAGYCKYCGIDNPKCPCNRDE